MTTTSIKLKISIHHSQVTLFAMHLLRIEWTGYRSGNDGLGGDTRLTRKNTTALLGQFEALELVEQLK